MPGLIKFKPEQHILWSILIMTGLALGWSGCQNISSSSPENAWRGVLTKPIKTPHDYLFAEKTLSDGPAVTRACLECHPQVATDFMKTSHWTWLGEPEQRPGRDELLRLGKKNQINNFCIGIEGNWLKCTKCHAGYGWQDATFDFARTDNVDCLVCHDQSGLYDKTDAGLVAPGVDLLAVAKSVGRPTRDNCGYCHFNGGGGDAVKHGDLDGSMSKPVERVDVHMGRYDFQCIDCHRTVAHRIAGRSITLRTLTTGMVECTDCHSAKPHRSTRLNDHSHSVSCQVCHIPQMAVTRQTKMAWDWSTAGLDIAGVDDHTYLKTKGSFLFAKQVEPEYAWFNGHVDRYIKGDLIDPGTVVHLNNPLGSIEDPTARIWPFKIHQAKQPYDKEYNYLLIPKTVGAGGYWTDFDWEKAIRLNEQNSGLTFSGQLGFVETDMYWYLTHMIAPKEYALRCVDCHNQGTRMDWQKLGYDGDPAFSGGRSHRRFLERREKINK